MMKRLKFMALVFIYICVSWKVVVVDGGYPSCTAIGNNSAHQDLLDIVWINLDRSRARRQFMLHQLKFYGMHRHHRHRAFLPSEVFIDSKLDTPWECLSLSNDAMISLLQRNSSASNSKVFVQTHCGRPKNTPKELAVTLSHLNAIRSAVYNTESKSNYALIMEDDLQFIFQLNFTALIESAPTDFAMLQLVTSNEFSVMNLYNVFNRHKKLWVRRVPKDDYWCAGGYIVNKRIMRPIIDVILRPLEYAPGKHVMLANMVAGYEMPCFPKQCCGTDGKLQTSSKPYCIKAPRGYQSDHYLFSLSQFDTHMLTVPVMTGSVYGNTSTFHQYHVGLHVSAFNRINTYVNELYVEGNAKIPQFVNIECRYNSSSDVDFNKALHRHSNRNHHAHVAPQVYL